MKYPAFSSLVTDMKKHEIDKEHYSFDYNGFRFDVILSIISKGYEILVAIHTHNWGCVLKMSEDFYIEMQDDAYYALRTLLNLDWHNNKFSSQVFLRLLSENAPKHSNMRGVEYGELRNYLSYRKVDDEEKKYFCGWNDHKNDKRTAHNFDKTEFYFGKKVADYCRKNNISSLWSDIPRDEKNFISPWD